MNNYAIHQTLSYSGNGNRYRLQIMTLFSLWCLVAFSFAQVDWQRLKDPVLGPGEAGEWDAWEVAQGAVLYLNGTYHMWYDGLGDGWDDIGYAISKDGIVWEKDSLNPVLERGPAETFDHYGLVLPYVIIENDTLHLFYSGIAKPVNNSGVTIGHSFSSDGHTWTKDSLNPVISEGLDGSWDERWIVGGAVVAVEGVYHIWYGAWDATSGDKFVRIGHASSSSLFGNYWLKDVNNPVIESLGSGSWEYGRVEAPMVVYDGTVFHMWYRGGNYTNSQIGYAWSTDGVNWEKYPGNPVLKYGAPGSWDDGNIINTWVVLEDSVFKMWYTGQQKGKNSFSIGYATAPVNDKLVAAYSMTPEVDTVSGGEMVSFKDESNGIVTGWQWDFGDGNTSNDQNPQHTYTIAGNYPVLLTINGPYGSDSISNTVVVGIEEKNDIVKQFSLKQNYPNPFNPITNIEYRIPNNEHVKLLIYNLLGQKIAILVNKKQSAGSYQVQWDASNHSSGIYIYRLEAGDFRDIKKMILLK